MRRLCALGLMFDLSIMTELRGCSDVEMATELLLQSKDTVLQTRWFTYCLWRTAVQARSVRMRYEEGPNGRLAAIVTQGEERPVPPNLLESIS